jgi:NAD(P)-dependent dehydrogenase (short-subunit alcohol dehydrogenase family)
MRRITLRGKNALVTGGGRGLGLEVARALVDKGANVAIAARDAQEIGVALADLQARAGGKPIRLHGEPCDLRDGAAIDQMLERVRQTVGPIDVVVNNAGIIQVGPLETMTMADFEEAMKLHCFGPLRIMLAVRDEMRARGGGRIANVASVGGLVSVPHLLPYSTSKFALVGLSRGMRAELARDGTAVSTIAPGLMRTGSPRRALFKGDHRKEYAWFAVSDSLPILSMSSRRAARRIVLALERGDADVTLTPLAKAAALASAFAPGLVARAMTLANGLLPRGQDAKARWGYESESRLSRSFLTTLTERAAARNNERQPA